MIAHKWAVQATPRDAPDIRQHFCPLRGHQPTR